MEKYAILSVVFITQRLAARSSTSCYGARGSEDVAFDLTA